MGTDNGRGRDGGAGAPSPKAGVTTETPGATAGVFFSPQTADRAAGEDDDPVADPVANPSDLSGLSALFDLSTVDGARFG